MSSDPESLNSGKAATNNRVFKICGVVFSLACVSAIAYAGMAGSSSGANGRRLTMQVCTQDTMQCNGGLGFMVMRVPELNCAFAPCPNGNHFLTPTGPHEPTDGTTAAPKNLGLIIGGSVAGAAALGGIIAGAVVMSKQANGTPKSTPENTGVSARLSNLASTPMGTPVSTPLGAPMSATPLGAPVSAAPVGLYEKTDAIKPAGAPGNVSQGMLVGVGALGLFALVFLAVTGAMYVQKKRRHSERQVVVGSTEEEAGLE